MRYIKKLYHNVWYRLTHPILHQRKVSNSLNYNFVPEEFPEGAYGAAIIPQAADKNTVHKPLLYLVVGSRQLKSGKN